MKRISILFLFMTLMLLLPACAGRSQVKKDGDYDLYYLDVSETALEKEIYHAKAADTDQLIQELIWSLSQKPKKNEHFTLLNEDVQIVNYQYNGFDLQLNMSKAYSEMERTKEVLVRAGLVRTLVQIDGVDSVSFLVAGQPLMDSKGIPIGCLNAASFIENSGKQINSYKNQTITLYFTNEQGTALIAEPRHLYYSSSVLLEQVVLEQLLKGPRGTGSFATLPSEAKVMSVSVVDKVCYVNFDQVFASAALNVQEEIPIYSIANSIIENCSVNKVQISIQGESDVIFRENMKLNELYEMNRDLIQ